MADSPFAGLGLKMPNAATEPTPDSNSPFSKLGLSLPNAEPAAGPAGGYYVPWLGKSVASSAEYEKLLKEHLDSTTTPEPTFREKAIAGKKELVDKISKNLGQNFEAGGNQFLQGLTEITSNKPWSGITNSLLGGFNATLGNVLSTAANVVSDTATHATGNKDFGEKAALLIPGPKALKVAAKTVPEVNALTKVADHIAMGGEENVLKAINTLRNNPTMTAMDISPTVESTAIGIAKGAPSKGQATLFERAGERTAEAPSNIMRAYDTGMGRVPNTEELLAGYKANARKIGQERIQPALDATGPVDITNVIKHIDEQIGAPTLNALRAGRPIPLPLSPTQERLLQERQNLTYHGKDEVVPKRAQYFIDPTGAPTASAIDSGAHGIQSRMRSDAESLSRSASSAEQIVGGALGQVRAKLVDAIDRAGGGTAAKPGPYKEALAAYRDEKDVHAAFEKGQEILSGARVGEKGVANRPEAFKAWIGEASDHEIAAARLGARTVIDNYIGTSRNAARTGKDLPEAPFTDAKIKMLFGEKEGETLLTTLRDERRKAEVNANLTKQSVTARALTATREIAPRESKTITENAKNASSALAIPLAIDMLGGSGVATSALLGVGAGVKSYQVAGRAHDRAVMNRYAEIASSTEPKLRNALIQALEAKRMELSGGKKLGNALTSYSTLPFPK